MRVKSGMNVEQASKYLKDIIYIPPHQIRLLARAQRCPFCMAIQGAGGRWSYYIHKEKLEAYKKGKLELFNAS